MDLFDTIIREVDEKASQLKDHLASGRAKNFEEYASLCGEIKGLLYVRGYVLDLKSNLETSDND